MPSVIDTGPAGTGSAVAGGFDAGAAAADDGSGPAGGSVVGSGTGPPSGGARLPDDADGPEPDVAVVGDVGETCRANWAGRV